MDFRAIRYALAVAKERSFTAAARRLNISQSAVSDQVQLLEAEIGFPLFRRTTRGVEQTERGRAFLQDAGRVAGDMLALSDTARRLRGGPQDAFRIGIGSGIAQLFMPRLFGAPAAPGVITPRLEIATAPTRAIFDQLHEERIDAGIAIATDPERVPSGLISHHLADEALALVVPPRHALARARHAIGIERIGAEAIVMSELSIGYGAVVMAMFTDHGIRPNIVAIADNIETIKVIVQSGAGIAIVPRSSAANEIAVGALREVPLAPTRVVGLHLFHRRQPLPPRKQNYVDALRVSLAG